MRLNIADLEREISKAKRQLDALTGKRNEAENALDRPGTVRWLIETRVDELQAEIEEIEDYLEMLEDPDILEPCSSVARAAGCTCEMADYNPPEPVRSRHCPLHGSEPDEDERR